VDSLHVFQKFLILQRACDRLNRRGAEMDAFGPARGRVVINLNPRSDPRSEAWIYALVSHRHIVIRRNGHRAVFQ
jgi:hypothetical protein